MSLLAGRRFVVIDTETTGWSPRLGHALLEVAAVTLEDGAVVETWSSLVRPGRGIPEESTRVHGITEAMVADAPAPGQVAAELRARCGDSPLVFHHASFDLGFIARLLREGGQPPLYNPVIDTLGLARAFPDPSGHSLPVARARLELQPRAGHRALEDAHAAADLLLALVPRWERERGVKSLAELAAASQDEARPGAAERAKKRLDESAAVPMMGDLFASAPEA